MKDIHQSQPTIALLNKIQNVKEHATEYYEDHWYDGGIIY